MLLLSLCIYMYNETKHVELFWPHLSARYFLAKKLKPLRTNFQRMHQYSLCSSVCSIIPIKRPVLAEAHFTKVTSNLQ